MADLTAALLLNRFGFGPRPGDLSLAAANPAVWLKAQLAAPAADDAPTQQALAAVRLHIEYDDPASGRHVSEDRPLQYLATTQAQLWTLVDYNRNIADEERFRPADEILAATIVRATNAGAQLREAMTRFWHNHFSVNAYKTEEIAVGMPAYDRIMRSLALGNFRQLLGGVAKSVSMMFYLDQQSSTLIHPNENYAREVMELHTLGIGAYAGRTGSSATGYTDEDVIQAARALTGWTIGNGGITAADGSRPNDGSFIFAPSLHDPGPKKILGVAYDGSLGQNEAERVLDTLAAHPATAKFLAAKLCKYFVSDAPPQSLIDAVAAAWTASRNAADQIAQVIAVLAARPEFLQSAGLRLKDPLQFTIAALRASNLQPLTLDSLEYQLGNMGYPLFQWPTPDGIPTARSSWTGTNGMLQRWNGMVALFTDPTLTKPASIAAAIPPLAPAATADWLSAAMLSLPPSAASLLALEQFAASPALLGDPGAIQDPQQLEFRLRLLAAATTVLPEFQLV